MNLLKVITVVAMSACLSLPVMDHRVEHYEGKSSDTLSDALSNFREYNRILEQHLSGDLTDEDLARVHELTYTLRSEEHTSELQSRGHLVCRLLLEKKKQKTERLRRRLSPTESAHA